MFEAVQEAGLLPGALGSLSIADSEPFNLSSFALSLLLVRRTQLSSCRALTTQQVVGLRCICALDSVHDALVISLRVLFSHRLMPSHAAPHWLRLVCARAQVFRTNESYARWDEARKTWGGVVNKSRNLVRQVCSPPW